MKRPLFVVLIAGGVFAGGCQKPEIDMEQYTKEITEWQKQRLTRLTRNDGWLTLVGLFWLKQGENTVGSDSSNTVILPAGKTPRVVGSISLVNTTLRLKAKAGSGVTHNDAPVASMELLSDADAKGPTILRLGTVSFYVIKRGDDYAVRVKDNESPARVNFKGLKYFPINPAWRFEARFEPYVPPKTLEVMSQIGTVEHYVTPGALVFNVGGKTYRLDPVIERGSEHQLFIMLADGTNGKETYAVGRQLYTALPDSNNKVILDFNKAYNWPCVFTEFATCPIPPPQNRMPFRVEAGEKMYGGYE